LANDRPAFPEVGAARALLRGIRKRCPRCGKRGLFRGWFELVERCPECGLAFQKEEGGFLGAMTINYAVGVIAWIVMLAVVLALTVPDVPVWPLLVGSVVILVVVPLWFYPRSKTLWAAVEYLVARSDPDYRAPTVRDPRSKDLE